MASYERKDLRSPDEVQIFEKVEYGVVNIAGGTVEVFTFEPGWKWSEHSGPIAGSELCEQSHVLYHIYGRLAILTVDGSEFVAGPGEVTFVGPGHDAWVVGDEPAVMLDWYKATNYRKG